MSTSRYRKFGGKEYEWWSRHKTRLAAKKEAAKIRAKGHRARIRKKKTKFIVYFR